MITASKIARHTKPSTKKKTFHEAKMWALSCSKTLFIFLAGMPQHPVLLYPMGGQ